MSKFWSNSSSSDSDSSYSSASANNNDENDDDDDSWSTGTTDGDAAHQTIIPNIDVDFNGLTMIAPDSTTKITTTTITTKTQEESFLAKSALSMVKKEDPHDPNVIWEKIKKEQIFATIPTTNKTIEKQQQNKCTRIVCISDSHSKHRDIVFLPKGDVLLHGGDFTKSGEIGSVQDLSNYFKEQFAIQNFEHIICIAGNHELTFQCEFYKSAKRKHKQPFDPYKTKDALKNCIYLEDQSVTLRVGEENNGSCKEEKNTILEVYGSPWTPAFYDWAFNLQRGKALDDIWSKIPTRTDVLITHGPPLGRGDFTDHSGRTGCYDLLQQVQTRIRPRLHVFGHIHQSYGVWFDGKTLFVNASNLDSETEEIAPHRPCLVIDLPHDSAYPAKLVLPDCTVTTVAELQEWLKKEENKTQYTTLHDHVMHMGTNVQGEKLPIVNAFTKESAYFDLCSTLNLHRDKNARTEFRRALFQIYAESFS